MCVTLIPTTVQKKWGRSVEGSGEAGTAIGESKGGKQPEVEEESRDCNRRGQGGKAAGHHGRRKVGGGDESEMRGHQGTTISAVDWAGGVVNGEARSQRTDYSELRLRIWRVRSWVGVLSSAISRYTVRSAIVQ